MSTPDASAPGAGVAGASAPGPNVLRVASLRTISTDKWEKRWRQQQPHIALTVERVEDWPDARKPVLESLRAGALDAALIRLSPGESPETLMSAPLHCVTVYDENQAVLLSKEHPLATETEIDASFLDEFELRPALLPAPVARDARQQDLVAIPVTGLEPTSVALVWLVERDADDIQQFVGIVRGRTNRSSRG